jgi:4-hydroxy-2-oxoheptanedioate aldolase
MAAEASGITPVARPTVNSPEAILRVLDRGALGVQVPHVSTADDARRAVEAVKYHPLGGRGLGAGIRSAGYGFGVPMRDYVEQANRESLVCVQLEDVEALRNLDQILLVDGVDVFFLGPSDLAQSMGYPGQVDAPEVQAALKSAFETIAAAGKAPGSAGNADAVSSYMAHGALYLYTHLTTLLAGAANRFLAATRDKKR